MIGVARVSSAAADLANHIKDCIEGKGGRIPRETEVAETLSRTTKKGTLMSPQDPRHPWSRLAAAARRAPDDRDTAAPPGFVLVAVTIVDLGNLAGDLPADPAARTGFFCASAGFFASFCRLKSRMIRAT